MISDDSVTVTTLVAVEPEVAFAVFTEEVDSWWKRGPRYRFRPGRDGRMQFEPGVGGRLLEIFGEGDVYEVGRILDWEPAERLTFEFRPRAFGPEEVTEVKVRFEKTIEGTRVTIEHGGWDGIGPDHPARHGFTGEAFSSMMGLWWADQLVAIRARTKEPH